MTLHILLKWLKLQPRFGPLPKFQNHGSGWHPPRLHHRPPRAHHLAAVPARALRARSQRRRTISVKSKKRARGSSRDETRVFRGSLIRSESGRCPLTICMPWRQPRNHPPLNLPGSQAVHHARCFCLALAPGTHSFHSHISPLRNEHSE